MGFIYLLDDIKKSSILLMHLNKVKIKYLELNTLYNNEYMLP
jgi:hypothetical protein